MNRRRVILLAGAVVLAGVGGFFWQQQTAAVAPVIKTTAAPVGVGALGRVEPASRVRKLSQPGGFSVNRVARLLVTEGETVTAGQMLAELSDADQKDAAVVQAEAALAEVRARLTKTKAGGRPSEIEAQEARINALGAVNLAALEELGGATEKKNALDAQATDLNEAIGTLETAIRRIDKETRERLMATFAEANGHLATMFPALFGGGHAELVLTGEEILDSGVQIFARPPGKKNASIQLLSGGEKALTAMSLVFSLFQLNPAPFCLLDEVDAPLDVTNTERFRNLLTKMSEHTQFLFISHNKITMEGAHQLVGVTMQEQGVSRVVTVDMQQAMRLTEDQAA